MAGYRVGIALALPAFDTYNCLEKLARYPNNRQVRAAYRQLVRRAEQGLLYDALSSMQSVQAAQALISVRTGISVDEVKEHLLPDLPEGGGAMQDLGLDRLTEKDWVDLYKGLCEAFGDPVDLDPSIDGSNSASESYSDGRHKRNNRNT